MASENSFCRSNAWTAAEGFGKMQQGGEKEGESNEKKIRSADDKNSLTKNRNSRKQPIYNYRYMLKGEFIIHLKCM